MCVAGCFWALMVMSHSPRLRLPYCWLRGSFSDVCRASRGARAAFGREEMSHSPREMHAALKLSGAALRGGGPSTRAGGLQDDPAGLTIAIPRSRAPSPGRLFVEQVYSPSHYTTLLA